LWLDDHGPYWFLHPLFERLRDQTGQYIDLYGDALFSGDALAALERVVAEARELVASQPEAWQVHVGTQLSPEQRELYRPAERARMLALLEQWGAVVQRARALGLPVVCLGD
jgi:hypothetical protein